MELSTTRSLILELEGGFGLLSGQQGLLHGALQFPKRTKNVFSSAHLTARTSHRKDTTSQHEKTMICHRQAGSTSLTCSYCVGLTVLGSMGPRQLDFLQKSELLPRIFSPKTSRGSRPAPMFTKSACGPLRGNFAETFLVTEIRKTPRIWATSF